MFDTLYSVIRIGVASAVGWVVAQLTNWGVDLDPESAEQILASVQLVVAVLYYGIVRALSQKFPQLEWLLGIPKSPVLVPAVKQKQACSILKRHHIKD